MKKASQKNSQYDDTREESQEARNKREGNSRTEYDSRTVV